MASTHNLRQPADTGLSRAALLHRYEQDRPGTLLALVTGHGPVLQLAPGTFLVTDPPAVQDIYQRTNTDFLMARDALLDDTDARRGTSGLDDWMTARRAALTGITPPALTAHTHWLDRELAALADRWLTRRTITDPLPDLRHLTVRSFIRFCFGDRDTADLDTHLHTLDTALRALHASSFRPPILARALPRHRRARRARHAVATAITRILTHHPGSAGLADTLATAVDHPTTIRMLISAAVAAYGVPAAATAWTLHALARHPTVADQIAATPATGDDPPPTIHHAINESLRLWPPTWLSYRATDQDQPCGDWLIPAGSAVMLSPYVTHRTATCYPDPTRYQPDRWATLTPHRGAYTPFGAGPRWCLGARFATLEITRAVTILGTRLRFTPHPEPVGHDAHQILTPTNLTLTVTAR